MGWELSRATTPVVLSHRFLLACALTIEGYYMEVFLAEFGAGLFPCRRPENFFIRPCLPPPGDLSSEATRGGGARLALEAEDVGGAIAIVGEEEEGATMETAAEGRDRFAAAFPGNVPAAAEVLRASRVAVRPFLLHKSRKIGVAENRNL